MAHSVLVETIASGDAEVRNRPLAGLLTGMSLAQILDECEQLERFRRASENLYHRVRACLFLSATYRFHVQEAPDTPRLGPVPFECYVDLLERRF